MTNELKKERASKKHPTLILTPIKVAYDPGEVIATPLSEFKYEEAVELIDSEWPLVDSLKARIKEQLEDMPFMHSFYLIMLEPDDSPIRFKVLERQAAASQQYIKMLTTHRGKFKCVWLYLVNAQVDGEMSFEKLEQDSLE